jgi:SAM-dependent methyltransferase
MGEAMLDPKLKAFAVAYAEQREAEGRRLSKADLLALPWLRQGPQAGQWAIRARTFETFMRRVLQPMAKRQGRPLTVLDLGAGNGWLSYRAGCEGHLAIALDIRADKIDGLGATDCLVSHSPGRIERIVASFDAIPLADNTADVTVFNASLHYSTNLSAVLHEAHRVSARGGVIAILDSPFYRTEAAGRAMVAEKQLRARQWFGERAATLTSLDFIEFLTAGRLAAASRDIGLEWRRHRVSYPLAYELRPLMARMRRHRSPSRFDLWTADVR